MLGYIPFPSWIKPQVLPFFPIRWLGLMTLVAILITYLLFTWQVRERKLSINRDLVLDMFFWAIVGLLVGARALAVTIYDPTGYYLSHPLQIILPFSTHGGKMRFTGISGMSYHGGLMGVVVALIVFAKVKKIDVLQWGDMLVAGVPLGYTFGRLADFFDGELYGRITKASWGILFSHAEGFPAREKWVKDFTEAVGMPLPGAGLVNLPRHPSQLYEAFFEGILLWAVLWFIVRRRAPYKGFVIAWYLLGYGIVRFFIEYVRQPDRGIGFPIALVPLKDPSQFSPFNFSTGQILNLLMIAAGLVCLAVFRARARRSIPQASPRSPSAHRVRKMLR